MPGRLLFSLSRSRLLLYGFALLFGLGTAPALPRPDDVGTLLRTRIEAARHGAEGALTVGGTPLRARQMVVHHYQQTGFQPSWLGPNGPTPLVDSLLAAVWAADADGLRPTDYHAVAIDSLTQRLRQQARTGRPLDERALVDLDLLCTDAFLLYGAHLTGGRVDPVTLVPSWTLDRPPVDLPGRLQRALDTGAVHVVLRDLRPSQPGYDDLRRALARHRTLVAAGGWPALPDGPVLKENVRDPRVPRLRRRLQATGDLSSNAPVPDSLRLDESLRQAVGRFQERHGLSVDGVVGSATRAALNVPAAARLRQIEVNMERWRWLPNDLGNPHVLVNIADFWLRVVEDGRPTLQTRVVVGMQYRQTPIFSDRITYLVFNPYWHVPRHIAVTDKLPDFQRNPALVSRLGFEVLEGWGSAARRVDPSTIDWDALSAATFPYRLRQKPGPLNALGQVKFMFPNRHTVYLHDTPDRALFNRSERDFSSGCIRVEHPAELAAVLLRANGGWTLDHIRTELAHDTERAVVLQRPVPVHLLYWTAWMEDGTLHFRRDIYGRDGGVERALLAPPAAPSVRPLSGGAPPR